MLSGGLDPCLDVFDGIVLVYMLKLVVQNLHLCLHLTQCGAVYQRDLLPAVDSIPVFYLKTPYYLSISSVTEGSATIFHICYFRRRFFVTEILHSYVDIYDNYSIPPFKNV